LDFSLAGFEVTPYGRIEVTPEATSWQKTSRIPGPAVSDCPKRNRQPQPGVSDSQSLWGKGPHGHGGAFLGEV